MNSSPTKKTLDKPFLLKDNWIYIPYGMQNLRKLTKTLTDSLFIIKRSLRSRFSNNPIQQIWITQNSQYAFQTINDTLALYSQKRHSYLKNFGKVKTCSNWIKLKSIHYLDSSKIEKKSLCPIEFPYLTADDKNDSYHHYSYVPLQNLAIDEKNQGLIFGSFKWDDQGFGFRKGHLQALLEKNGDGFEGSPSYELFNIALRGERGGKKLFCINQNELEEYDINKTDRIVFRYRNGCSHYHQIIIKDFRLYTSEFQSQKWARTYQTKSIDKIVKEKPDKISKEQFERKFGYLLTKFDTKFEIHLARNQDDNWYDYDSIDVTNIPKLRIKGEFTWNDIGHGNMGGGLKVVYVINDKVYEVQHDAGTCPQSREKQEFCIVFDKPENLSENDECLLKVVYRVGLSDRLQSIEIDDFQICNFCEDDM